MTARALRPKADVHVEPAFVSQLTSLQVLGVDGRRYLEHVVPLLPGEVTRLGKLRLLPLQAAIAKLRELAHAGGTDEQLDAGAANDGAGSLPATGDGALARWGFKRTSASGGR